jgi:uncharacterized RmlC-like cupin family protein
MSEDYGQVIRVIRHDEVSENTPQTEGITRLVAIDNNTVGAKKLWFGLFKNYPGANSGRHHHGEAETAAYIAKGNFRVYYGDNFEKFVELGPGDCVFIPPYLPHIEVNEGPGEAEGVLARSPDNIVVPLE